MKVRCVPIRTTYAHSLLSSSSGERSETGGPSGAEGDPFSPDPDRPRPRQCRAPARRWVPRSAPRRRGLPEDDERNRLSTLATFQRSRQLTRSRSEVSVSMLTVCSLILLVHFRNSQLGHSPISRRKRFHYLKQEAFENGCPALRVFDERQ